MLKAAGFPQPIPEFGQIWANETEQRFIINYKSGERKYSVYFAAAIGGRTVSIDACAYCPTVLNLLQDLPGWNINYEPGELSWFAHGHTEESFFKYQNNKNAADLLAEIWLDKMKDKALSHPTLYLQMIGRGKRS